MTGPVAPAQLLVNGHLEPIAPGPDRSLLFVLRDELGLTGAKPGCGEGACGACTVLLEGEPVAACQVHLSEVAGRAIRTVEGLAPSGSLHPVQQAFLELGAFQCGYCTAGMIMRTVALLEYETAPGDASVRAALDANACRCCTYPRILRAVERASEILRDDGRSISTGTQGARPVDGPRDGDERWSDGLKPRLPWDLADPEERDWFEVLAPGLVCVLETEPPGGDWATSTDAWLHVGEDGSVTAFTGKVDVGQDNRTALSVLVADELRVPLASVRLVMGDTDLCPRDDGTFASRSMRDAGELLRATASGARARLVRMAAERLREDPAALVASDGAVHAAGGAAVPYGDLLRGLRRVESVRRDEPTLGGEGERLVGRPTARVTGGAIVTGGRRFPSDLSLPGMLHGRVLRPSVPGASLVAVDTSAAAALPGVAVAHDGPFVGVVAPDPFAAARALGAITAEWDRPPLPSDDDLSDWLRAHPTDDDEAEGWAGGYRRESGDVDAALELAPTDLSATYTTAYVAHVPLETRVALAAWDEGRRVTVWTGTQVPFGVRAALAEELGLDEKDVRVIVPDTGGGFGGKHDAGVALEAARLARSAGRPVRVRWSRPEEFTEGYLRPAAVIDVRSGADGTAVTAWEMRNLNSGMFGLEGPYRVPNQRLVYQPAASPLRQGSYRALAATANHFARESHMDELAHALGADPLELRLANLEDERLATVLRTAAERIGWGRAAAPGRGLGVACGVEKGARVASAVEVAVDDDRRLAVLRTVTAFECGRIVNPDGLANQVEGAIVMGLGGALFEAVRSRSGVVENGTFSGYRVPRIGDVPPVEVVLLDRPDLPSAGGGETPIVAIAPALANALFAATGVRLRSLPLVPDGILPL